MGKKLERWGTIVAVCGVIGAVAATGAMWWVVSINAIFIGFVIFVVGRLT